MVIFYRSYKVAVATILSVSILVSCEASSTPDDISANNATNATTDAPVVSQANVNELAKLVAELKNAVGIRDYEQANVTLSKLSVVWTQIEADIKAQQPSKHEAIEIHLSSLENDLASAQPNAATISSDLKLLETVVYQLL
ncbi:MAG: hypothetical protein AAFZ17_03505 [Cyanobacteria bacterium J06650_10]